MTVLVRPTPAPEVSTFRELPFFGRGNGKLPDSFLTFSLPSGHTCPGALTCLALSDRNTGQITDGPQQIIRCYEVSTEQRYPTARNSRWRNFDLVRHAAPDALRDILLGGIERSRQHKTTHVRWFAGGDCFSVALRDGIIAAAERTPDLIHYFYTKNLPLFVVGNPPRLLPLPQNLRVTASWGGKFDHLIEQGTFPRSARVLNYEHEAEALGLPVDKTDYLAWTETPSHFCHLSHGFQPPGTPAAEAIKIRRRNGEFTGYGSKRKSGV